MGIWSTTKTLASLWAENKKTKLELQGKPNTKVDSGGTRGDYSFDGQEIDRGELRDIKNIRESGGVVATLVDGKALMQFGPGADFEAEEDDAAEWLHEQFNDLDNLLLDIGTDATWFPFALGEIVETAGGGFSHVELVEPWTIAPKTNDVGEIIAWEQEISGKREPNIFEPDELASFVLNKKCGRDKIGISEVARAEDEITAFKENQKVVNDALEYLVPHNHWKVGAEGQAMIDDNELRRVRNMVQDMDGDTQFITGPDIEQNEISLPKFDVKEITENDIRQLCVALGVPIELASVISEGLGSGEQSSARQVFFDLEKRAKQRALGGQFIEQVARILLRDYSPYDAEQKLDLVFRDSKTLSEKKEIVDAIGQDLTVNERRRAFDYAELDDESKGESFDSPGEETQDDPMGGLFNDYVDSALDERDLESGTGNRNLSESDIEEIEYWLDNIHSEFVTAEDTSKTLTQFNESELPQMVKNRLRDAILGDAIFSQFDTLPSSDIMQLRNYMVEELSDQGWSIDGLANRLQDLDPNLSMDEAETIARTETQSAVNHAAESAYEAREGDEEFRFKWVGQIDNRTTEACRWLLEQTNPNHGGEPVTMDKLKELIQEAPEHDPDINTEPRTFTPHINCRKRYVRVVE